MKCLILQLREAKPPAQSHTVAEWQDWDVCYVSLRSADSILYLLVAH